MAERFPPNALIRPTSLVRSVTATNMMFINPMAAPIRVMNPMAPAAAARCEMFFRSFGTGRFFVFLGALLTEIYFILGIVGGAKKNKEQKAARQAQAGKRR